MSSTQKTVTTYATDGTKDGSLVLPPVFSTPFRKDLIHKAYTNLNSHKFQPQGRHPSAGTDVVADSNDPPTGRGISRIARMRGGGGGRQGQAGEVASTRGGRQAHPPIVGKKIHKKLNKKENKLALCSAIAATASRTAIMARGHKIDGLESFPIIVSDNIESFSRVKQINSVLESLNLMQDVRRLDSRRPRTGKSSLRGRSKKVGKSVLFVTSDTSKISKAVGALPGVDVRDVKDLSVLDLAPGSDPIRLTIYSVSAINEIAKIRSTHLGIMSMISKDSQEPDEPQNADSNTDAVKESPDVVQDSHHEINQQASGAARDSPDAVQDSHHEINQQASGADTAKDVSDAKVDAPTTQEDKPQ